MYLDSNGNLILKGDPFRLKYTVVPNKSNRKQSNIIISNTKPTVLEVTGSFTFTQSMFNVGVSGFTYESPDQLLKICLTGGFTGAITQYSESPVYAIPIEYMNFGDNIVHSIHSAPSFITGAITGG